VAFGLWDWIRGIGGKPEDEADLREEFGGEDPGEAEERYLAEPRTSRRPTSTRLSLRETPRPSLGAVQRGQSLSNRDVPADKNRGIALGVPRRLGVA
jgi:hypothetical protein